MEIGPTTSTGGAAKIPAKTPAAPKPKTGADSVSLGQTEAVHQALQQTPDVRPEAVNLAASLVSDTKYPAMAIIQAIGNLLALNSKDAGN